jgi:hypothetical protein
MNDIQNGILTLLPPKRKATPSGWTSFNAPCCVHNSERRDERQRGGILLNGNGGFQYHCFNCNFKAGWQPGKLLSKNTKSLFKWLGMPDTDISKLNLYALRIKDDQPTEKHKLSFELDERQLPEDARSIVDWISEGSTDPDLLACIEYVVSRGMEFDWYPWHWSPANGYKDRILLPFYHDGKVVGWTGRKIRDGKPKYLTDAQPGYVFNLFNQNKTRAYVITVEGQFDAVAIDGVAIMHNEPNETQAARINALGREVIVVPDRDKPGAKMIEKALEYGWSVSLPEWTDDVKDVADAVKKYGRLYTLFTILHYKETNTVKIQLLKKKLENIKDDKA